MSKVICRLEGESSSLSSSNIEKLLLILEENTSFDSLVKDIKNKAKNLNFTDNVCNDFRIKYFDETAEEEVCISSDQDVRVFLDQIKNPNTKKENKVLSFKILSPSNNSKRASSNHASEGVITAANRTGTKDSNFPRSSFGIQTIQPPQDNHDSVPTSQKDLNSSRPGDKVEEYLNKRYSSIQFIGSGGFGSVYSVTSKESNSRRAIKLMKIEDFEVANTAMKEFQKMIELKHENIVATFDSFFAGSLSTIGIEMELMKGSLFDLFIKKQQILPEKMILDTLLQTCLALECLQTKKIIHRDIKPHNILVRSFDLTKQEISIGLADFGMARSMDTVHKTGVGGTVLYFSPEIQQAFGLESKKPSFSYSSDMFALGVTIYQLISFDLVTSWATLVMHSNNDAIRQFITSHMKANYSDFLVQLIMSMIRLESTDRISVSQLLGKLSKKPPSKLPSKRTATHVVSYQQSAQLESNLGKTYLDQKNYAKAYEYFARDAKKGNVDSEFYLGFLFEKGLGVKQDAQLALQWYERAANHGHIEAQYVVGTLYEDNGEDEKASVWYKKASIGGHASAQNCLGYMYELGYGVLQDYDIAFAWYLKAANQNNVDAQYNLARLYEAGLGVDPNASLAFSWYQKAAEKGDVQAQYRVGFMYEKGKGVKMNYDKALEIYTQLASQGVPEAENRLGFMNEKGLGGLPLNYVVASEWYQKAASKGNANAQFNLGYMYEKGYGVWQSYDQAILWYTEAAKQGHLDAQYYLGEMYEKGIGVDIDYIEAVKWYKACALQGDAEAQLCLCDMYYKGLGVEKNETTAFYWCMKSAGKGNAQAQNFLGYMYDHGIGTQEDQYQAFEWYQKSAKQGNTSALINLGYMYHYGHGVTQSYEKAFDLYSKAANKGDDIALFNIGVMYENGEGVEQNSLIAREWYEKSANKGNADAKAKLLNFSTIITITPEESEITTPAKTKKSKFSLRSLFHRRSNLAE